MLTSQFEGLRDNKLSKQFPIFDQLPVLILLSALAPVLIVLLFTYLAFKLIVKNRKPGKLGKY